MTSIAGIDLDSNAIDVVLIDEDTGAWLGYRRYDLDVGPGGSLERARRVRDVLPVRGAWADAGVVAIGLEDTRSKQRLSIAAISRIQGALATCLPRDVELLELSVNRRERGWKALTAGKTNASKDEIRAWAIAAGAPEGLVQDAYDAFAIATATRETLQERARKGRAA
jgi:hypothetical protein